MTFPSTGGAEIGGRPCGGTFRLSAEAAACSGFRRHVRTQEPARPGLRKKHVPDGESHSPASDEGEDVFSNSAMGSSKLSHSLEKCSLMTALVKEP